MLVATGDLAKHEIQSLVLCSTCLHFINEMGKKNAELSNAIKSNFKWIIQMRCMCAKSLQSCPTLLRLYGLQPTSLLSLRDFLGKHTEVHCHTLFQGIFPTYWSDRTHVSYVSPIFQCIPYHQLHLGSPQRGYTMGYTSHWFPITIGKGKTGNNPYRRNRS